jgi:hypothetical protein
MLLNSSHNNTRDSLSSLLKCPSLKWLCKLDSLLHPLKSADVVRVNALSPVYNPSKATSGGCIVTSVSFVLITLVAQTQFSALVKPYPANVDNMMSS